MKNIIQAILVFMTFIGIMNLVDFLSKIITMKMIMNTSIVVSIVLLIIILRRK